ncbi:MAG: aminotransferase class V-fold PLP-dependent enzyme [Planctomycetes bacterium]|nr:aminotransferase class V-fold PLP-dependent enzyme [Planctomycetota bacterium]
MTARLYLDHAATSPLHPAAAEVLAAPGSNRADPSAAHARLARALDVSTDRLVLTPGGSQANALAVCVLAARGRLKGRFHALSQPSEHPSVLEALEGLAGEGLELEWLSLDREGRVDPTALARRLRPTTAFVSVMSANHETGARQPMAALAACCAEAGVALHSDAVQAFRYAPPSELAGDVLTLGGHKLGGPRGIGALLLGARAKELGLSSPSFAGPQPSPRRILALAEAIEARPLRWDVALAASRDALQAALLAQIPGLEINGPLASEARLPGHLSLSLPGLSGEALVLDLDLAGIAASSGAACASGTGGPSPVLLAMGRDRAQATGSLRLTLGSALAACEQERVVAALAQSAR